MLGGESGDMFSNSLCVANTRKSRAVHFLNLLLGLCVVAAFAVGVSGYVEGVIYSPSFGVLLVFAWFASVMDKWCQSNMPPKEILIDNGVLQLSWPVRRASGRVNHLDLPSGEIDHITISTWNGVADEFRICRHRGSPVILRGVQEPEALESTLTSLSIHTDHVPMRKTAWLLHHNLLVAISAMVVETILQLFSVGVVGATILAWLSGAGGISTIWFDIVVWSSIFVGIILVLNGIFTLKLHPLYLFATTPPFLRRGASLVASGAFQVISGIIAVLVSAKFLMS